jgi:cathepsin L
MEYVKDSGIMLDKDYPYTAVQDKCKGTTSAVKILDHKKPWSLLSNNTETVKETLATLGPLSISVDAYRWQFYISGVFNDCHDNEVDHSVLLVGYQEDGTWIVKNSWSDAWGEQGYIRIANKGSACLIRNHVIIPHLATA